MLPFNPFEIRRNIEEKRVFYGKKLEDFVLAKIALLCDFLARNISHKSFALIGSIFVVALSIFLGSTRDLGYESSAYLLDLKHDASPLFLAIVLWVKSNAEFLGINAAIIAIIFANLCGILLLLICAKNLSKSDLVKNSAIYNLTIIAIAIGFFLRVFTSHFNEFFTTSTCFLFLAFSYFSYQFSPLKSLNLVALNLISAMLLCFNLNDLILVAVFEFFNLVKTRNFKDFVARNFLAFLVLVSGIYYQNFTNFNADISYEILKFAVFPLIGVMLMCWFLLRKYKILENFYLLNLAAILLVLLQQSLDYDKEFIIFSLSVPSLVLSFYLIVKEKKIAWLNDWVILFLLAFLPVFALKTFSELFFDLVVFWWVFVLWQNFLWRKIPSKNHEIKNDFAANIFWLRNFNSFFCFSIIAFISIRLGLDGSVKFLPWFLCFMVFFTFVIFSQKVHEAVTNNQTFSHINSRVLVFLFSYFLALHLDAIFAMKNFSAQGLKSPNFISDEVAKTIKNFAAKDEKVTFISSQISNYSSLFLYLDKDNKFSDLSSLKQRLKDPKNKLIFVEDDECKIGFIEEYLYDEEFAKIFFENYTFLNRIYSTFELKPKPHFYSDKSLELYEKALGPSKEAIDRDVEVYVRKTELFCCN